MAFQLTKQQQVVFFPHAKSTQWDNVYMLFFHFHQNDGGIQTASTVLPVPLMSAANFTMMYSSAGGHKETARLTEVQPGWQHFQNSHFLPRKMTFKDPKTTSAGRAGLLRDFITAVVRTDAGLYWITNETIIL